MMAATQVSAGAASSGYYKSEGYYIAGSEEDKASAQWFGKHAQELGLEGRVDDALFTKLLDGQTFKMSEGGIEEGRQMGRMVDGQREHRPGIDLTFSAPKSVSIAALVYQDERVTEAHDKAVQEAMKYVEASLVQTRITKNDKTILETGGKIIAGLFRHDTSRALDPQLHTHAVIANQVKNSEGSVTALHNGLVYKSQKLGSEIYRDHLASGLRELGYTVERTGKDRLINLAEVPKELEVQFSKRRQEIETALEKRNVTETAKTAELAALATRASKNKEIDRAEISAAWQIEAKRAGIDEQQIATTLKSVIDRGKSYVPGEMREEGRAELARSILEKGIANISERTSTYSKQDLLTTAASLGSDKLTISDLEQAFTAAQKDGTLVPVKTGNGKKNVGEDLLTDKNTILLEKKIVATMQGSVTAATMPKNQNGRSFENNLQRQIARTNMTEGQQESVINALSGRSRFVGVQGSAGTGKTYMMEYVAVEAARAGYRVEGLAPSHQAVSQMKDAIPNAETLQARLMRGDSPINKNDGPKTILVVDEASLISNSQMLQLMEQAEKHKIARVVLVGDTKQLDGVAAGTPFALLQNARMPTSAMNDIIRQRDDNLLSAVQKSIAGEVKTAFEKISDKIVVDADYAKGAAQKYSNLTETERKNAAVLTPSNNVRLAINEHVREALKQEGTLAIKDEPVPTLDAMHLTKVEASDPRSYRTGDVLIAHRNIADQGIQKNTIYDVSVIEQEKIVLTDRNTGATNSFDPTSGDKTPSAVALFEPKVKNFAAGDQIRFGLGDKKSAITNGDKGTILNITSDGAKIELADGSTKNLAANSLALAGMDHSYAQTGHSMQGATVDRIIVAMGANEYLANQKSFYVGVSRARDEATLVTDSPTQLIDRLEKQTGEKIIALEAREKAIMIERDKSEQAETTKSQNEEKDVANNAPDHNHEKQTEETEKPDLEQLKNAVIEQAQQIERGEITR